MPVADRPSRRPPAPFEPVKTSIELPREALPSTLLFEVAWEVCNQVGGIYQVIRSKAPLMTERFGDDYCLIGPYVAQRAALEFERTDDADWLSDVAAALNAAGLPVHHGRWLVQGRPRVLLIEHERFAPRLAEAKYLLWEHHGIESPANNAWIDGAITFCEAVHEVLESVIGELTRPDAPAERAKKRVLLHCHEWQTGLCIALARRAELPIASVFTTHATMLGRYIASSGSPLYERLATLDPAAEARHFNIRTEHMIERLSAQLADVFTTVSSVTAEECTALLGRTPEVITPNGLTISRYNVGHDFQTFHADFKEQLHAFAMGYFFPHYAFDLDKTLYFFTSGRYEPGNKGFDLCLEAMARLNAQLKAQGSGATVVFFIVSRRPVRSLNPKVLEKRAILNELRGVCGHITEGVGEQLFKRASAGQRLSLDELVEEYWGLRFRRTQAAFRADGLPPVVTHILEDDQQDPVLNQIRAMRLFNAADDPVKIVYHPDFINPENPLWGLEYEQFVRGCHLGLFPSAYEPWGYTPLECMALGTPAVSSDLAGFGRYVQETYLQPERWGLTVLARRDRSFNEAAHDLSQRLLAYCKLTRRERVALRNEVERRAWDFDWSRLGVSYKEAHELALSKQQPGPSADEAAPLIHAQ
jgi:glycogen(starch) synthase